MTGRLDRFRRLAEHPGLNLLQRERPLQELPFGHSVQLKNLKYASSRPFISPACLILSFLSQVSGHEQNTTALGSRRSTNTKCYKCSSFSKPYSYAKACHAGHLQSLGESQHCEPSMHRHHLHEFGRSEKPLKAYVQASRKWSGDGRKLSSGFGKSFLLQLSFVLVPSPRRQSTVQSPLR